MLHSVNVITPVVLSVLGVVCFICAPVYLLKSHNVRGATLLGGLGVAALLLTRLPDITSFNALGIQAELRRTIDEANAKITQLRELGLAIAEPELSQLAMSGVIFAQLNFRYRYERKQQIVTTLKSLGAGQDEIKRASEVWIEATLRMLSNVVAIAIAKSDVEMAEKFKQVRVDAHGNAAKPPALQSFLLENHVTNPEVTELVADYEYLFATGDVRRPEVFPPA